MFHQFPTAVRFAPGNFQMLHVGQISLCKISIVTALPEKAKKKAAQGCNENIHFLNPKQTNKSVLLSSSFSHGDGCGRDFWIYKYVDIKVVLKKNKRGKGPTFLICALRYV